MKKTAFLILVLFVGLSAYSQYIDIVHKISSEPISGSKLYVTYKNTENEDNVDGDDAVGMLSDYLREKTKCVLVTNQEDADFIVELQVIKKDMGNRRAKVTIRNLSSESNIFASKWTRGTSNAFYAYSSTGHAVGKIVKGELFDKFPGIAK